MEKSQDVMQSIFGSSIGSRIESVRTIPEMYSGLGARMRLSQVDVDGALSKVGQKKPAEIQWSTLTMENSKTMLGCSRR